MFEKTVTIIEAKPQTLKTRLLALWKYRSFYGFLFRELTMKKFRGTFFGFWWLAIRPLIPAIVFILMFSVHPMEQGSNVPYPIFFLSGFVTWNVFNSILIFMPRTLLWMQDIMRRTYFPRLLVPLAAFGAPLIEFIVLNSVFLIVVCFYWITQQHCPLYVGWQMLWLLPCLLLALLFSMALGMFTSVVALFFRDVVFSISYFSQMFMFLTPVVYPVTFIPKDYRWLVYAFNPMAKLVEVSRWSLTGKGEFDFFYFSLAAGTIFILFLASVAFFFRAETYLTDQM